MARRRSWLVAAMIRTSTFTGDDSPTRRISPSWSARRSLAWKPGVVSPISSMKRVPPLASSKSPMRARMAPVKAPRAWPKSSLSSSVSVMAAQFTGTKGWAPRRLPAWMARATSSLPVPDSPVRSTVASVGATRTARSSASRRAGERPTTFSRP